MGIGIALVVGILVLLGLGGMGGDGLLDCRTEYLGFVIIAIQQGDGTWDAAAARTAGPGVFTARSFPSCETALQGARDLIDENLDEKQDSSFEDQEKGGIIDKGTLEPEDEDESARQPDPIDMQGNCRVFVQGSGWYEPGGGYNAAVFTSTAAVRDELGRLGYPAVISDNKIVGDAVFNFQIRGRALGLPGLANAPDELMDNVPGVCTLRALGFARAMRRANTWSK